MQDLSRFALAANLKRLLLAAVALLLALQLSAGLRGAAAATDRLQNWTRHQALVASTAEPRRVELEVAQAVADGIPGVAVPEYATPYEPGNARILVPAPPVAMLQPLEEIVLLQDPEHPSAVALLSWTGLWAPSAAALVAVCILLLIGRWLLRAPWGEDVCWTAGTWAPTETSGSAPGMRADPAQAIREPRGSRKATVFWTVLFGVMTLALIAAQNGAHSLSAHTAA